MAENKIPTPRWKGCIIFGIVNIGLVLLCTKLNIIILSVSLILLIAAGVVTTMQSIKEDWQEGFKLSAVGCVIGLLLNLRVCTNAHPFVKWCETIIRCIICFES